MAKKKSGLTGLSTAALQRELERRQSQFSQLKKRRDQLIREVLEIDDELKALSGAVAGGAKAVAKAGRKAGAPRGPRPKNAVGLPESLAAVLKGKTMTVSEAAEAVKKAGYKTNAVNFRVMVNQAFIKHKKLFKKVKHGHYTTV